MQNVHEQDCHFRYTKKRKVKASMETKVVNPDESLATLYANRRRYERNIRIVKANPTPDNLVALKFHERELSEINAKIAEVEKAMQTPGKQVRLF